MDICIRISFYETHDICDLGAQAAQCKHARPRTVTTLTRIYVLRDNAKQSRFQMQL
jgi:hypothetical protein